MDNMKSEYPATKQANTVFSLNRELEREREKNPEKKKRVFFFFKYSILYILIYIESFKSIRIYEELRFFFLIYGRQQNVSK